MVGARLWQQLVGSWVSPRLSMEIPPCLVAYGSFISWTSWPAKPLWFWFIWVDRFTVCLFLLNPSLDAGPLTYATTVNFGFVLITMYIYK